MPERGETMPLSLRQFHVSVPFTMLRDSYLERFTREGLNPEIGVDGGVLDTCGPSDFEAVASRLRDRGLSITLHGPFVDLSPGSSDERVKALTVARLEQVMGLIPAVRPKVVVCHAGYDHDRYWYHRQLWLRRASDTWAWFAGRLRDHGVRLVLENVYERTPDELVILCERLEPYDVGWCFDTGHHRVFGRESTDVWLNRLGRYLRHLHLHDNAGDRDDHLALGRGSIDFPGLLRRVDTLASAPPVVTLEPHREEDLGVSIEYLNNNWPW